MIDKTSIEMRLHAAVDRYNALNEQESDLGQKMKAAHESKLEILGRIRVLEELRQEIAESEINEAEEHEEQGA